MSLREVPGNLNNARESPLDRRGLPWTSMCTKSAPEINSKAISWHPKTPARLPSGTQGLPRSPPGSIKIFSGPVSGPLLRARGQRIWLAAGTKTAPEICPGLISIEPDRLLGRSAYLSAGFSVSPSGPSSHLFERSFLNLGRPSEKRQWVVTVSSTTFGSAVSDWSPFECLVSSTVSQPAGLQRLAAPQAIGARV